MKMKYQRAPLLSYMNRELSLRTKQNRSLNSASIVGVIISLDTGQLREWGAIFAVTVNGNLLLRTIYFIWRCHAYLSKPLKAYGRTTYCIGKLLNILKNITVIRHQYLPSTGGYEKFSQREEYTEFWLPTKSERYHTVLWYNPHVNRVLSCERKESSEAEVTFLIVLIHLVKM